MSSSLLLLRMAIALVVIFALLGLAAKFAQRRFGINASAVSQRRGRLNIVSRATIAKSASVVVVRLNDRELVLGVTPSHITLLSESEVEAVSTELISSNVREGSHGMVSPEGGATPASPWTTVLERLRERTIRHA